MIQLSDVNDDKVRAACQHSSLVEHFERTLIECTNFHVDVDRADHQYADVNADDSRIVISRVEAIR